jgi:thiol:disulfide interchange protein
MKKLLPALIFSVFSFALSAQILEPVKWSFSTEKISDKEFELVFTAKIDEGWNIYSQFINGDGPVATSFSFDKNKEVRFKGKVSETSDKIKEGMDEVFGIEIKKFGKRAIFKQKVKVSDLNTTVTGVLEYMTCDDEKCLPPTQVDFSFTFPKSVDNQQTTDHSSEVKNPQVSIDSSKVHNPQTTDTAALTSNSQPPASIIIPKAENETPKSLWAIFIAGFIGGLLALLTPCVFPIIPMTVSFFTKTSKDRRKGILNAMLYGIAIIVIYVGLGFIVTKALGADALNEMASNAFFNLAFFFIFVIFAISFFGYFEITLPSSFVNKMDSMSDRGGLIGIFFMAFTLSLVSFSCTGPIIGTLLVEAAIGGSNTGPLVGMFGFSLALALPFALFAAFPAWLNSLPKSGGWLNSVKVILGFLELGLALKFLSNVDLAYHWGFLKREIFLGIWLVIAVAAGLYLLGKIRFPHDSAVKKLTAPRIAFAALFFAFALYLVPGLKGANLKLLSGFPPPMFYSIFETKSKCPHDINCFKDLNEGLAYAKIVNKPVMVDFTGWSCVNCRKMEENVWIEPEILKLIDEKYVLVSLYVDDKTALPEAEQKTSDCTGKKIRTVGNKWSEYQTCTFQTNTQPYYVLMKQTGEILNVPVGYTPDANEYKIFLEDGLKKF